MTYKRYFRNFMIDPAFQLEFTMLLVVTVFVACVMLSWFTYNELGHVQDILHEASDVSEATIARVMENLSQFFYGLLFLLALLIAAITGIVFIVTHRIAGAKYAIIKYMRESLLVGNYEKDLVLRNKDYLKDVALELNHLAKKTCDSTRQVSRWYGSVS